MNKNLLLWAIIIVMIIAVLLGMFYLGRITKECDTIGITPIEIKDNPKAPEIKFIYKKSVVGPTIAQLDSITEVAKNWWLDRLQKDSTAKTDTAKPTQQIMGLFTATKDTTYVDTTGGKKDTLLIAHTEVESRIPLDPLLQFYMKYTLKKTTITHEVEKPETFFDRFGASFNSGMGYGWFNKKIDFFTGFGFHFKL